MGTKRVGFARLKSLMNENTNGLQQRSFQYQTISSDTTLTMEDAGQLIGVNGATAVAVTLPAVSNRGAWFRFVLTDNTANVEIVEAGDSELVGSLMGLTAKDTATSADTKIRFASGTALAGDWVEVGQRWSQLACPWSNSR